MSVDGLEQKGDPVRHVGFRHEASILPFELHVLEVAIGDVCQQCSGLVKELESSGHPILDTLVKHVGPQQAVCADRYHVLLETMTNPTDDLKPAVR
jgi:hypothetical protein